MSDHTIIAEVGTYIIHLLRKHMIPGFISHTGKIELLSPLEEQADYTLGIYLYNIESEEEIAFPVYQEIGGGRRKKHPKPYNLYYMIYVNALTQMRPKTIDTHKMLGKIIQIMNDYDCLLSIDLANSSEIQEPPIILSQCPLTFEDKVRVWQSIGKPYQPSLFYKAAPAFLSSGILLDPPRVTQAIFDVKTTS